MPCWKSQRELLRISTNPFLLTWMKYSPALSLASRMNSGSVPRTIKEVSSPLLSGRSLSDYRSAVCGVYVRFKSKDRRIFSPYNLGDNKIDVDSCISDCLSGRIAKACAVIALD